MPRLTYVPVHMRPRPQAGRRGTAPNRSSQSGTPINLIAQSSQSRANRGHPLISPLQSGQSGRPIGGQSGANRGHPLIGSFGAKERWVSSFTLIYCFYCLNGNQWVSLFILWVPLFILVYFPSFTKNDGCPRLPLARLPARLPRSFTLQSGQSGTPINLIVWRKRTMGVLVYPSFTPRLVYSTHLLSLVYLPPGKNDGCPRLPHGCPRLPSFTVSYPPAGLES